MYKFQNHKNAFLNPIHKAIVKAYTTGTCPVYTVINWNLRNNEHWNVENKLAAFVIALKFVCERGYNSVFKKEGIFKPYHGTVYRGIELRQDVRNQILNLKEEDQFYFGGFTSTSKSDAVAAFLGSSRVRQQSGFRDATLLIRIEVDKEHFAGVDIQSTSEIESEAEVLLSCYTRFEVVEIQHHEEYELSDMVLYLKTLPPKYTSIDEWIEERNAREEMATATTTWDFKKVLDIHGKYKKSIPNLINSTRPSSNKFYTALHQASDQGNVPAMKQLQANGATNNCWNHLGLTPQQVYEYNHT